MARGFAASKTKKEFLERLGLVEGDVRHEEIFRKMLVRDSHPIAARARRGRSLCWCAMSPY